MWYLKLLAQAGVMQEASEFSSEGEGQAQVGEANEESSLPPEDQGQKAASKNQGWEFSDEVQDAMSYDPFAPKDEGEDDEQGAQKSDEEQEGAEDTEGKQGEKGEKEEGAQKEGAGDAELKEQLKQAQTVIDQYKTLFEQQQQQQQQETEGKKEEKDPGKEIPNYPVFNIPDPIKEMLFSDDPNKLTQGLGMMLQGVAQVTHMRVRQEMEERFKNFADNEVPAKQRQLTEEEKAKDTQKQIRKDWVENYPDLAGEELKPLVAQVATMVSQEMNAKEWNEDLHKAIAARVRKILGRSSELPEKKKEEAPKKKVPFSSAGTNRQGAPSKVNPQLADISDTLGL